jgi:hypothetical protein
MRYLADSKPKKYRLVVDSCNMQLDVWTFDYEGMGYWKNLETLPWKGQQNGDL